jgi:NAD(P)-dependent dehydrogenase (short-subunit alcohol dehydrogenase family)
MSFPTPNFSVDLTGRTALVTGASSGLGVRFARTLAKAGAKVAIAARRLERLESLAEEIRADGGEVEAFALDVSDAEQLEAIVPKVEAALGPVDILVNNAGMPDARRPTKMAVSHIDEVLAVNLRAPFILSREVAGRLIELKLPGRIVNISSAGAYIYSGKGGSLYSITKSAIIRLTEVLSVEWAEHHINVNAIAPGTFHSEMVGTMLERRGDMAQGFPRKRIGDPAQMDSTLLFLVSPASEMVTGTIVRIDDGQMSK